MRSIAVWTRVAALALSFGMVDAAHADTPPQPGAIPQGWVWQGSFQDGKWTGQWVPGVPGAPMPGTMVPATPPAAMPGPASLDPDMQRMLDRCLENRHGHGCEAFFAAHPDFAPGIAPAPAPYPAMPYPPMVYPAMVYMMVPVITVGQQKAVVETHTTVTTEYVTTRRHCYHARPHRKEKRVYTGS